MKKIVSLLLLLSCLFVFLLSCGTEETPKTILDFFPTSFNDAKEIVIESTIKAGNEITAKETRTYNNQTGTVTIVTLVLASIGNDSHYDQTTESSTYDKSSLSFKFTASDFEASSLTLNGTELKGTLKSSALSKIDVSEGDVIGDVKVSVLGTGSHVASFAISYTSPTTNTVVIQTTFNYN